MRPAPVKGMNTGATVEAEALVRSLKAAFDSYASVNPHMPKDVVFTIVSHDDPAFLSEYMPANLLFRYQDKQAVMNENTLTGRLETLLQLMQRECEILELENQIQEKVTAAMDKSQREYYLHEQMRIIGEELGETDDTRMEAETYLERIAKAKLPDEVRQKLEKECARLAKMQGMNQEGTVIRTYLDTCLELPWGIYTKDNLNIHRVEQVLNRDHYGLKKVKERILEILAVRKLAPNVKGQIICLAGPPGVGKTSIARSIADALGKKVRPHEPGRRAGRSRDPRSPPYLHRCHARQDHQCHDSGQEPESADFDGRNRQAGQRL